MNVALEDGPEGVDVLIKVTLEVALVGRLELDIREELVKVVLPDLILVDGAELASEEL